VALINRRSLRVIARGGRRKRGDLDMPTLKVNPRTTVRWTLTFPRLR
jgi:hypothetical protein